MLTLKHPVYTGKQKWVKNGEEKDTPPYLPSEHERLDWLTVGYVAKLEGKSVRVWRDIAMVGHTSHTLHASNQLMLSDDNESSSHVQRYKKGVESVSSVTGNVEGKSLI